MIPSVAGCVARPQRGPLHSKDLSILDLRLSRLSLVLVDLRLRANPQEIGDSVHMVSVPMGQQRLVDGGLLRREDGLQTGHPGKFTLARVDEDASLPAPNQVCVRSW